jgi:hypothetical protein
MASTILCPSCKGQVGHMRGQSLPDALERHLPHCPGNHMVVKRKPPTIDVPLPEPPKPRVRVIPRADPPKKRKR